MNIKIKGSTNLNESQQFQQTPQNIANTDTEEIVMKNKSKQFKFSCGVIMARIDMDVLNRFGLKWHYSNSSTFEEFVTSVRSFISVSGNDLTDADVKMLGKQYDKADKLK